MSVIDKVVWIRIENRMILSTRSYGKEVYCLPGGKREPGESDLDTLVREVREELSVAIVPETASYVGTFEAQAYGKPDGALSRASCYAADYTGTLAPANEIESMAWLGYADRDRVAPVEQVIFDHLHDNGQLD